jgi:uncharacterized cupredoxin-like copper-binding protein
LTRWTPLIAALVICLGALSVSCGIDSKEGVATEHGSRQHGGMESFDFGEPAVPEASDRRVKVTALDALAFDPSHLRVTTGETVAFEVTNVGNNKHEFVIGDAEFQREHEEEMSGGATNMRHEGNTLVLDAGETGTLPWTFRNPGEVLYGCHEPGHYAGGMVGTIEVGNA